MKRIALAVIVALAVVAWTGMAAAQALPGVPTGGLRLDLLPWSAQVFVDGKPAGQVGEFNGYFRPLVLPAGPHVLAVVLSGYEPMLVVVNIVPGRTITYRAYLTRY
jgi:hypothetical protein